MTHEEGRLGKTPRDHPPEPRDDLLYFSEVVRFFRRNWLLIGSVALVSAVAAVAVLAVFPPSFEATATLVVIPPQFSSDLKPKPLSVQGYQRLLESDGVVTETFQRLVEKGILKKGRSLRVGAEIRSRIYVSRRAEETALAPVIEVIGQAESPDAAAAIANTWASVFLERSQELAAGSVRPTVQFIDEQYQESRTRLETLGQERMKTANKFQKRMDDAANRWDRTLEEATKKWDRRLVDFQKETEDLIADFQTKSRLEIEALAVESGLIQQAVLSPSAEFRVGREAMAGGTPGSPEKVEGQLFQLVALRVQLAQTPQFLVLEKALSDDALWQVVALGENELVELQSLLSKSLLTQEINPVYSQLKLRVSEIEILPDLLSSENRERTRVLSAGLERIQLERSAGLSKLKADRAAEFAVMKAQKRLELEELRREKNQELDSLERQKQLQLDELDRRLAHARNLFDELAQNFNEAELARALEHLEDVRLGSPAVASLQPMSRHLGLKGLAAVFLGGLLGAMIALGREVS